MRRQSLIALGVAVFLGLIAVFLANSFLTRSDAEEQARGTTKVAVAAVPLAYGNDLTREKIKFVDFPNTSIPPGAFTSVAQLLPPGKKRFALMAIAVNEPILNTKITAEGEGASMAALLPDGMRAASVRINDVSGVAGFVRPNDSVDVLITRSNTEGRQITDVLLQNVRVMAIGQNSESGEGKPQLAPTATLMVDPLAAQKLALAQSAGSLTLVLRKPGEVVDNPFVGTVSIDDLRYGRVGTAPISGPRPTVTRSSAPSRPVSRPQPRPAPQVQPRSNSVDVVRGTQNSSYEVGNYGD